jgi:general secretion pathway protein B
MSYILEALKKLEEKRHAAETPRDLLAMHGTAQHINRRPLLRYALVAVLLLNAGLLVWWLHPWQSSGDRGAAAKAELRASVAPAIVGAASRSAEKSNMHGTTKNTFAPAAEEKELRVIPDVPASATTERDGAGADQGGMTGGVNRQVYSLDDLPPSVRQELPTVTIAGHFYSSDSSARVVVINGKTVHEGQAVTGSLRLERITPDGVILDFQGYRFSRGVF